MRNTVKRPALHFRLLEIDSTHAKLVLYRLAAAPHSATEASYNAIPIRECRDVMTNLRRLDAKQLEQLAGICTDAVVCTIDMRALKKHILTIEQHTARHAEQTERARRMLSDKASNQMILAICPLLCSEDIRKLRTEMNMPVVKGRLKMPDMDVRVQIQKTWYENRNEQDLYLRYLLLKNRYPELNLGQLHTIVTDGKLGGGS